MIDTKERKNIFELTGEQHSILEPVITFVDTELTSRAAGFDSDEQIPRSFLDRVAETGLLGLVIPGNYGGMGCDMLTAGMINEEVGRGCSSVRSLLTVHGMVSLILEKWGTSEQQERWLPEMAAGKSLAAFALTEPEIGSDAANIQSTAVETENGYRLDGRKKWITFGQVADLFIVFCRYQDKPSAFLVHKDNPGLTIKPIHGMMGVRASMLAELEFKDCFVPRSDLVGSPGFGLSHIALTGLDYGRYSIAWGCVGMGEACITASVQYSRKRKQFKKALRSYQLIQKMLTEMIVNVKAARMLCYKAGSDKDAGDPSSIIETWTAKYFASQMIGRVTRRAVQIHGANGCHRDFMVERFFRDAKIMDIIEGTSQMHEVLIANSAMSYYWQG